MTELVLAPQPQLHDPAWVAQAMEPGPNGVRFDNAGKLLAAANLPPDIEAMYDSTSVAALPAGAFAYAVYLDGAYANLAAARARFGDSQLLVTITPDGAEGATYIDIEPGNVLAPAAATFIKNGGTGFYASPGAAAGYSVQNCIDACSAAGIPRTAYRVWSAHWIGRHICGPSTCGYPQADGTQFVSTAGWDESAVVNPVFFQLPSPPAPVPQEWTGDGRSSLAQAAALAPGQTAAGVLVSTVVRYGTLGAALAATIDAVFAGTAPPDTAVPAGSVLWLLAPPPAPAPAPAPAPPPLPAVPAWQTALYAKLPSVRLGDQDTAGMVPWVRQVQLLVNAAGEPASVDGDFGPLTQTALEAAQQAAGLLATGWTDPVTWEVLVGGSASAVLPVVAEGSGDAAAVRRVQALCIAHGLQLAVDGVYGTGTRDAVVQVQKSYYPDDPAAQDGVVGPVTWSLLAAHAVP
jgi:peptidoglycan hydrolase-like protein with peptidoglycan-binding domain